MLSGMKGTLEMSLELDDMILWAFERKCSDLFIKSDSIPSVRQHGKIAPTNFPRLDQEEVQRLCYSKLDARQQAIFDQHHEMDLAFSVGEELRIRMNVYMQRGGPATVCRLIPTKMMSLEDLGIPPKIKDLPRIETAWCWSQDRPVRVKRRLLPLSST
jgi:twitching motility protein PilT